MPKDPRKSGRYDPDPRRRSHRGHRKGVEPAGLKRWRLAQKTHDPGYAPSFSKGPRGGHYFHGPRKNRYDPGRLRGLRDRYRRHAGPKSRGKAEGFFNKWGTALGALIGGITGLTLGYNDYNTAFGPQAGQNYLNTIIGGEIKDKNGVVIGKRYPEIAHLWTVEPNNGWDPIKYLKYKFLGFEANGNYKGSAWVYPFWIGLAATIAAPIARLFTHKGQRFLRPLHKVGVGMLAVSTAGALALPGCPKPGDQAIPPPPSSSPQNLRVMQYTMGQNNP